MLLSALNHQNYPAIRFWFLVHYPSLSFFQMQVPQLSRLCKKRKACQATIINITFSLGGKGEERKWVEKKERKSHWEKKKYKIMPTFSFFYFNNKDIIIIIYSLSFYIWKAFIFFILSIFLSSQYFISFHFLIILSKQNLSGYSKKKPLNQA